MPALDTIGPQKESDIMVHFSRLLVSVLIIAQAVCVAQVRPPQSAPPLSLNSLPLARVPADPLEIVTEAQPVASPQQRLDAITLIRKARELSNVRAQPYDLKTSFVTSGTLNSDGSWMLEDLAADKKYRWTAQGPGYSVVNYYPGSSRDILYSNQPTGSMPLRLEQVRGAIFFNYEMPGPQASIRTANAFLNGVPQRCVLLVIGAGARTFSGGRNWEEAEYCFDAATGFLTTYSLVPGIFVHYDYSAALSFHGKTIPNAFTITEAGRAVVEARTLSLTDPGDSKGSMFSTAGLTAVGVGRAMNPPGVMRALNASPRLYQGTSADPILQIVVLHGNMSPSGNLSEAEVLASTDASFNKPALDQANQMRQAFGPGQPGVTPQSKEMFYLFQFATQR